MLTSSFLKRHLKRSQELIAYEHAAWDRHNERKKKSLHHNINHQVPRKRTMVFRDREAANTQLIQDYLSPNPNYGDQFFQRRFRLPRTMFFNICTKLAQHDKYWEQRPVSKKVMGIDFNLN